MIMSFQVKDKDLLGKLVVDKKVDFGFVREGDDYVVTTMK
ncbi:MAG: copper-binding protein [Pseudomonadota bacterium]